MKWTSRDEVDHTHRTLTTVNVREKNRRGQYYFFLIVSEGGGMCGYLDGERRPVQLYRIRLQQCGIVRYNRNVVYSYPSYPSSTAFTTWRSNKVTVHLRDRRIWCIVIMTTVKTAMTLRHL